MRGGGALPEDRESVLWLNVKEIPTKIEEKNVLQIALRTRIKIFYRPAAMPSFEGGSLAAPAALQWALVPATNGVGKALKVNNPTPYHVTFASLTVHGATKQEIDLDMVPPSGERIFPLTVAQGDVHADATGPLQITFSTINDYGAHSDSKDIMVSLANTQDRAE